LSKRLQKSGSLGLEKIKRRQSFRRSREQPVFHPSLRLASVKSVGLFPGFLVPEFSANPGYNRQNRFSQSIE
jgi:hypothetical protein